MSGLLLHQAAALAAGAFFISWFFIFWGVAMWARRSEIVAFISGVTVCVFCGTLVYFYGW